MSIKYVPFCSDLDNFIIYLLSTFEKVSQSPFKHVFEDIQFQPSIRAFRQVNDSIQPLTRVSKEIKCTVDFESNSERKWKRGYDNLYHYYFVILPLIKAVLINSNAFSS